jgi:hypothetical protein
MKDWTCYCGAIISAGTQDVLNVARAQHEFSVHGIAPAVLMPTAAVNPTLPINRADLDAIQEPVANPTFMDQLDALLAKYGIR